MRLLFIGGTGLISTACTELAVKQGHQVSLLNRGRRKAAPPGAETIVADARDKESVRSALGNRKFDSVVNWIAFEVPHVEQDIELFRGRTGQYVFISSATVYEKPPPRPVMTEDTPRGNPYWEYAQRKIECEDRLWEEFKRSTFPAVIVRPSQTYGEGKLPLAVGGAQPYTVLERMKTGKPVIVPGNGTTLWTITHNTDFAKGFNGLLGRKETLGEAFHITSDEAPSWNEIYAEIGRAAGVAPKLAHIPLDFLLERLPELSGTLLGDKAYSLVFDNSKLRKFVPDFEATVSPREGIRRVLEWYASDPARMTIDEKTHNQWDRIIDECGKA